ncbi:MAG: glycosyltransferase family 4 protein [Deltaproteobacteria bacterium]|nr:glycosyltransferase family 4 protein [Deltaproteobacteria bacterium]
MRIAHLIHQFPPERYGGAERHAEQLAVAQAERHAVFFYTQSVEHRGDGASEESAGAIRVRRWLDRRPDADRRLSADMAHAFGEFRPDVLHVHHGIGFGPQTLIDLARAIPTVATLHDDWWICPRVRPMVRGESPCPGPSIRRCVACFGGIDGDLLVGEAAAFAETGPARVWIRRRRDALSASDSSVDAARVRFASLLESHRLARALFFARRRRAHGEFLQFCRAVISPSEHLLRRHRDAGLDLSATARVIPYGIDAPARARTGAAPRPVRFAMMGSLDRDKGTLLAIRAFEGIDSADATLTLIGPWRLPEPPERALAGSTAVRYAGFVEPGTRDVWGEIDVLIVPSLWAENAPMVITEAHAAGVPVIAADHGALPEMVGPDRGGWLFTGLDAFALRAVVTRLLRDPGEIDRAAATIRPPVPIATVAELIDDVYRHAVESSK